MRIRFTSRAHREIEAMADYYKEHSPQGGANLAAAIEHRLTHLQTFPRLGRQTDTPEVRSLIVPRYPYKIFYRLTPDTIEVLSIFHTSQDPKKTP